MIAYPEDVVTCVARLYAQDADIPFDAVLAALPGAEDDEETLADIIDADGRARMERKLAVSLDRYLETIPDLTVMPVALDAAIEFALRAMATNPDTGVVGQRRGRVVDSLIRRFPALEASIRTTSMLDSALFSTTKVLSESSNRPEHDDIALPAGYGPVMHDGRSRYELRSRLGRGAHGAVYLAVDRLLSDQERPAYTAIKVLAPGADHSRAASVRDEAARARRVNHENVVRVLDRGTDDDGRGYIVYEYVDGPSLHTWLAQRPAPPSARQVARLVAQIARGVQAAHNAGVVHCDLKPDNIIMARTRSEPADSLYPVHSEYSPKITDFGIAVCLENARAAAHRNPSAIRHADSPVWGTLGFISPEQFQNEEAAIAPPADVYALGGILYYLLTGRLPNGQSPTEARENLEHVAGDEKRDPRSLRFDPHTDRDLQAICRRALAMLPHRRYASAEAFAADLESWLRREPLRWTPTPLHRRLSLFARRQPLACALLAAMLLTATSAGAAGVRWRMMADQRLMQAELEAERELRQAHTDAAKTLEQRTNEWHEYQSAQFKSAIAAVDIMRRQESLEGWLTPVIALESLLGREMMVKANDASLWIQRIDLVRDLVSESRASAEEPPILPLLWESALGFWILNDGNPAEARQVLARNLESWTHRTSPGDPWLQCLELLHACAIVREQFHRVTIASAGGPPAIESRQLIKDSTSEFTIAAHKLTREAEVFTGSMKGGSAHRAVLKTLHNLYGAAHLHDIERRKAVEARLTSLRQ